ncbi:MULTISPECIES: hypothetical protein [Ferrimonas]|uniref:VOC domain-containing protein n=1 Tax=Ferrimonas sediminum TaxID=718193 RepID=A0A1G9AZZ0_9GAMM|nr:MULTISPECIES: hypothetical protein [Ferrimonas]USD39282.1 hypothetical protein J8Z22_09360 [Ferrimonas sp. SCSIO 43195]SDK32891.1 hypothetical protein SAMN04488540_12616 [Ferrimonas sediminum]
MRPRFQAGRHIIIRIPPHEYPGNLSFYRDVLALEEDANYVDQGLGAHCFCFGDKRLVLSEVKTISQLEIWLHVETDNVDDAAFFLATHGVVRRDEIAPLPDNGGFWVCSGSGVIHLIDAMAS